jgi:UDP-N-acetylmuramyl pentapeptide phosphotransferase/UDP-N-acetylglucosamine-1-phosphate transferase
MHFETGPVSLFLLISLFLATGLITAGLCQLLMPLLRRYALARPNARSSHVAPTPQGGGIAVLAAILIVMSASLPASHITMAQPLVILLVSVLALALIGFWDDIHPLPASLRLILQALAVGAVVWMLEPLNLVPFLPDYAEKVLIILAGLWFVNLTNFMDGLDWLTVAGFVPLTGFIALLGLSSLGAISILPPATALLAACLCGALAGFAPFNKPIARLFLGDVGSLPIGLIAAYLLYAVAGQQGLIAALLLPLYHVTDATLTLVRRLIRRERIWESHRSHAYQQATTNGFSAMAVAVHLCVLNLILAVLALMAMTQSLPVQLGCLGLGLGLVLALIRRFTTPRAPIAA